MIIGALNWLLLNITCNLPLFTPLTVTAQLGEIIYEITYFKIHTFHSFVTTCECFIKILQKQLVNINDSLILEIISVKICMYCMWRHLLASVNTNLLITYNQNMSRKQTHHCMITLVNTKQH